VDDGREPRPGGGRGIRGAIGRSPEQEARLAERLTTLRVALADILAKSFEARLAENAEGVAMRRFEREIERLLVFITGLKPALEPSPA
jgi:hypothetical protein